MIYPLASWLAHRRLRQADRAAWVGFAFGVVVLILVSALWLNGQIGLLRGLFGTALILLLLMPAVIAALAALSTALELKGEQFQFLLLTTLPDRFIVQGCLLAAIYRTRYVRALAVSAIPALVVGGLAEALAFLAQITYPFFYGYNMSSVQAPGSEFAWNSVIIAVFAVLLWSMTLLGTRVGVVVALRWRIPALGAVIAPLMVLTFILSPVFAVALTLSFPLGCPVGAYLFLKLSFYLMGQKVIQDARRWVRQEVA